jgi:hypothetical protein
MPKRPLAHAATLLPLAIGLGMTGLTPPDTHVAETAAKSSTKSTTKAPASCTQFDINVTASTSLGHSSPVPGQSCSVRTSNGFVLPDPMCTPGAINPTVTAEVLQDPSFHTDCVRSHATSESQKNGTYALYGIPHPAQNSGQSQTCELDHLISLELGGADTLDNIWPQCGPSDVALSERFFKRKDAVENFLARQVREGKMSLEDAQKGIASDWTQFLAVSEGCDSAACE